jgi:activator of HSP90 ATPase
MSTNSSVETQAMYEAVRSQLVPSLLPHFHSYRSELIKANAKDLGHEDSTSTPVASSGATATQVASNTSSSEKKETSTAKSGSSSLSTTKAEVEADLSISKEDLWDLLTNQARIPMWTRAPAQVSEER